MAKYIDSGGRQREHAVGAWLEAELNDAVAELRWQTGFFSQDGLAPFVATIERLSSSGAVVHAVIGSNDGGTVGSHILTLANLLKLPRPAARLGIVSYANAFFHPKTYHLVRSDGSQAAYVGSANLGLAGIGALHIEAGVLLDTKAGDSASLLTSIANAVDAWFDGTRGGMYGVLKPSDVQALVEGGVLTAVALPRPPKPSGSLKADNKSGPRPTLKPLVHYKGISATPQYDPSEQAVLPSAAIQVSVPHKDYPEYALFAPGKTIPTVGVEALSGASLPGAATGIILRWTRDSDRYWRDAPGTANISIPVPTIGTLRFGFLNTGKPRAEFDFDARYIDDEIDLRAPRSDTNVMLYGFDGGTGHRDTRMPIKRQSITNLLQQLRAAKLPAPKSGDFLLLEWPTLQTPAFRITAMRPGSIVSKQAEKKWDAALSKGEMLGRTMCWLPGDLAPPW